MEKGFKSNEGIETGPTWLPFLQEEEIRTQTHTGEKKAICTLRRAASGEAALPARDLGLRPPGLLLEPTGLWHFVTAGPGHERTACAVEISPTWAEGGRKDHCPHPGPQGFCGSPAFLEHTPARDTARGLSS